MEELRKVQILVVDDEMPTSAAIADTLGAIYEVLCAHTVEDALDQLLANAVGLVLLDCVLPGGTMWQVLLEADRQQVPVVLMTGDREQMREIAGGPRPYVLKPFSVAELLHAVAAGIGMPASTSAEPPEAALSSGKAPSI
jgi:DNA-binding response OmpR family regulator